MFKKLKNIFAKVALSALVMQLVVISIGVGPTKAFADSTDTTGPELISVTAVFDGVSQTVPKGEDLKAFVGQDVGDISATLSETATLVGSVGEISISGGSIPAIPDGTPYGTFTLTGNIVNITPNPGNAVLAKDGFFTFTVAEDMIKDATGNMNEETDFVLHVKEAPAPELVSVKAVLGGVSQTKLAGDFLTARVGQSVGNITAIVSQYSSLVSPLTKGQVTISSLTIPADTSYGTFIVNPSNTKELIITPNTGNDVLALEGTFTFTVEADQIQSLSENQNEETSFELLVTAPIAITAIESISGTPQVGQTLTTGALTPVDANASYQWQNSSNGSDYSNISGAVATTYTTVLSDLGKYIKVIATGINGYSGVVTSNPTTVVTAAPTLPYPVTNLIVAVSAEGFAVLNWTNPTNGNYKGLTLYRDGAFLTTLAVGSTTFTDTNVVAGYTYYYSIATYNDLGSSMIAPVYVSLPSAKIAAGVSDSTVLGTTTEEQGTVSETIKETKDEDAEKVTERGLPAWGIILLLILAAIGGYLIYSQKPAQAVTKPEVKPVTAKTSKKPTTKTNIKKKK